VTRLEDRLRDHFRDEVAGLDAPNLLPAVLAAGRRARMRQRLVAAASTAALTVAVIGGAIGLRGFALEQAARPSATQPGTVLTKTELAPGWGQPSGIAAVPGGVWLTSWDLAQIVRIDSATGRITARIPVGKPQDGPYSVAYGAGSLWVTDFQTSDLLRLNPLTGHQAAAIHLPGGIRYVAVGGGYVWVTTMLAGSAGNRLVKIDPATNRILASRPVPGNYGDGGLAIAATRTAVWLLADGGPAVQTVDPASLHLLASARTGAAQYSRALAASGQDAWALIDGTLSRIEPPWAAVSRHIRLYPWPSPTSDNDALGDETLAADPAGTLWVAGPALYQVNEATMHAMSIARFGAVDNVAGLGQVLWVQARDATVFQVALQRPSVPANGG
jgi:streptogramin lyase